MIGDIFQPTHLIFVLVVALLVLGPKRLPEVGRALGRGLRDFRHALSQADPRDEIREHTMDINQTAAPTPASTPVATPAAAATPTAAATSAAAAIAPRAANPASEPVEHQS